MFKEVKELVQGQKSRNQDLDHGRMSAKCPLCSLHVATLTLPEPIQTEFTCRKAHMFPVHGDF